MRLAASVVIVALTFGLAGCGPSGNTVVTPGGTVTSSSDGSVTTIKGANGEVVQIGQGASALGALPDFLPLYPGAKVTASVNAPDAGGAKKVGSVTFDTNASVAEIIAFYKGKAQGQGLSEAMNTSDKETATFMAMKDQTMLQVIASKGSDATNVVISWTAPK